MPHFLAFDGAYPLIDNRTGSHSHAVVEGELEPSGDSQTIRVIAPEEFRQLWPTVGRGLLGSNWREVPGPARLLSCQEWAEITGNRPHG